MKPIWNEQIDMWKTLGCCPDDAMITEGFLWIDGTVVKGFLKNGNCVPLFSYRVSDDLNITIKRHKQNKYSLCDLEAWGETVERCEPHLAKIEQHSIDLLRKYCNDERTIVDTNSTGKDSMVKTHIAHKAGLKFDTYFNVTTLDVGESTKMAKDLGYRFIFPDLAKWGGFYQWINRTSQYGTSFQNIPSRVARGCCCVFKETSTVNYFRDERNLIFLFGMRNDESNTRSSYTDEWIGQKWNETSNWLGVLPIHQWSELDVWLYIFREGIPINRKYQYGYNRVGCAIACPNYTKTTWVLDKYWYPTMYNRWQNILLQDFRKTYKWLVMNCTEREYLQGAWTGGAYRSEPTQEVVEEFAKYEGISLDIAEKYFGHVCDECAKRVKDKDTIAMNMKLHGRNTDIFYCKKHMMRQHGMTESEWNNMIESFKQAGCQLF